MTTTGLARAWIVTAGMVVLPGLAPDAARSERAEDILARSKAIYAALHSYADSGSVVAEYGPVTAVARDTHTFHTYFRSPRLFYFDFTRGANVDRFVVWSDEQAFHTWWKTTGLEDSYGKGQGINAFVLGASPTKNAIMQISPLLFPGSGLVGTLTEFGDPADAGREKVDGHDCYVLTGVAKSVYRVTGHETNFRRTTLWIDTQTLLVRRVREEPKGTSPGTVNRTTTTFSPHANPPLDDSRFRFTPPESQPTE